MSDSESIETNNRSYASPIRWRNQMRRLIKLSEAQAVLGWGIVLILITLIGTIYLIQASAVAETGRRVQILQNDLADLKRENAVLERQIAEAQSLDDLQSRALALGFVPANPEEINYVVVPNYPAISTEINVLEPVVDENSEEPITTFREAVWLRLNTQLGQLTEGSSD